MKTTKQKEAILAAVCTIRTHPTADVIYDKLRKDFPRISLGTVYRNLNAFVERGDIGRVSIPGSGERFDYRLDKHEHLVCEKCGKVLDVDAQVDIKPLDASITFKEYSLVLYGICNACLANETKPK